MYSRFTSIIVLVSVIIGLSFAVALQAQGTAPTTQRVVGPATYTVVDGDTVWGLNPADWPLIKAANATLFAQPGREFMLDDGRPGLLIKPGEVLTIPAGVTITFRRNAPVVAQNPPAQTAAAAPIVMAPTAPVDALTWNQFRNFGLLTLLILLLALAALAYLLYRMLQNSEAAAANRERVAQVRHQQMLDDAHDRELRGNRRAAYHANQIMNFMTFWFDELRFLVLALRREVRQPRQNQSRQTATHTAAVYSDLDREFNNMQAQAAATSGEDFIEVHRSNGERFSMTVRHGSTLRPQANGVATAGTTVILTDEAARSLRDRHATLRSERQQEMAGV